jgi:hypothetical protein
MNEKLTKEQGKQTRINKTNENKISALRIRRKRK